MGKLLLKRMRQHESAIQEAVPQEWLARVRAYL